MDLKANDQLEPSTQNLSTVIALRPTPMRYATPTRCATPHPALCTCPQLQRHTEKGASTCHYVYVRRAGTLAYVPEHSKNLQVIFVTFRLRLARHERGFAPARRPLTSRRGKSAQHSLLGHVASRDSFLGCSSRRARFAYGRPVACHRLIPSRAVLRIWCTGCRQVTHNHGGCHTCSPCPILPCDGYPLQRHTTAWVSKGIGLL